MIVLLAGMPRSGSTFSFNVVRDVLRARGTIYQEASGDMAGAVRRSNGAQHVLLKCHAVDTPSMELAKAGAARIIITIRRIEDALASWITTFEELPEDAAIDTMRNWLRMFRDLRAQADIVTYDQIDRYPWLAAWRIARTICPNIGAREVIRIARRFNKAAVKRRADTINRNAESIQDVGWSYYDTESFFHRRHVSQVKSRAAEKRLPPERVTRLRDILATDILAADL